MLSSLFGGYVPLLLSEGPQFPDEPEGGDGSRSNVQFSCEVYYGDLSEGSVTLDIIRIGALDSEVSVVYKTHDKSGQNGTDYEKTEGVAIFQPGDHENSITVPLIHRGYWSATVEFQVSLSAPMNCGLGGYLNTCRVKILDESVFPSEIFREAARENKLKKTSGLKLYLHYCRWNVFSGDLFGATLLTLLCDQLQNIYELMIICVDMYLVNVVCNPSDEATEELLLLKGAEGRRETAYLIAALHVVPWAILLLWGYTRVKIDLKGRSAQALQKHMYRKYMNLPPSSLEEMGPEVLDYGLLEECPKVAGGFDGGLKLVQEVTDLGLSIMFVAIKRPMALPLVGLLVLFIILWGLFRDWTPVSGTKKEETAMSRYVKETSEKHSLICEYLIRPQMNEGFEETSDDLRLKAMRKSVYVFLTKGMLHAAPSLFVGAYIILNVPHVLDGELRLGTFLAMIKVINSIAKDASGVYYGAADVTHTFNALRNVAIYFNRATEVALRKDANRQRRRSSKRELEEEPGHDAMPIFCKDVSLTLGERELLAGVNFRIKQGDMVGVFGPNSSGKNTLMSLLAHLVHPTGGELFMPSHLRPLLVSRNVLFLNEPLIPNLSIGIHNFNVSKDAPRIKAILKDLELPQLLTIVEEEMDDPLKGESGDPDGWLKSLSAGEKIKVALARAFLANAEVMLIQKPFAYFTDHISQKVKDLLREHTRNRGLHVNNATAHLRRPRTILFTTETKEDCAGADLIWEMVSTGRQDANGCTVWTLQADGA